MSKEVNSHTDSIIPSLKDKSLTERASQVKDSVSAMKEDKIKKDIEWFKEKQALYEDLADKVAYTLDEILTEQKIDFSYIDYRVKQIESFQNKLRRGIVNDGQKMQDLAGIRVICYILSDVEKISATIRENFEIIEDLTKDKSEILGEDKVGYQSVHFVCKLSKDRLKLVENKKFTNMIFEVQVRTILQHAWAQIEHEKKYKFRGELPKGIPRRFNLISGLLELADNEFERISSLIEEYSVEVKNKTKKGNLDIPINSTSVTQYLLEKFGEESGIYNNFTEISRVGITMEFLADLNIASLKELDRMIPKNIVDVFRKKGYKPDFADIVIDSGYIQFITKLIEKKMVGRWTFDPKEIEVLKEFGVNTELLVVKSVNEISESSQKQ